MRKFILAFLLGSLFTINTFASATEITTIITDQTTPQEESDAYGDVNQDENDTDIQEPESLNEEESSDTSLPQEEPSSEAASSQRPKRYQEITINVSADFDFDYTEESIYMLQLQVETGISSTIESQRVVGINLFRDKNFVNSKTVRVAFVDEIYLYAAAGNDNANLFNIYFDDAADGPANVGKITNIVDGGTYDVHLLVTKNEEAKVRDPNLAPELSDDVHKIFSGEYGESRAAEIEATRPTEETIETTQESTEFPENPVVEPDEPEQKGSVVFVVIIILILIALIAGTVWYVKKCRSQDDDD